MNHMLTCAVCGFQTVPGEYDICSICGWEQDLIQESDPDSRSGANALESLRQAQERARRGNCQAPKPGDIKDAEWRPLLRDEDFDSAALREIGANPNAPAIHRTDAIRLLGRRADLESIELILSDLSPARVASTIDAVLTLLSFAPDELHRHAFAHALWRSDLPTEFRRRLLALGLLDSVGATAAIRDVVRIGFTRMYASIQSVGRLPATAARVRLRALLSESRIPLALFAAITRAVAEQRDVEAIPVLEAAAVERGSAAAGWACRALLDIRGGAALRAAADVLERLPPSERRDVALSDEVSELARTATADEARELARLQRLLGRAV